MILDIGCGSGIWQSVTTRRGQLNFDILRPKQKINNFILGDAHQLPFKENCFEKTFFIDVVEHVENPVKCLKELKRVTISSGEIIVGTPNAVWLPKIIRCFIKKEYQVFHEHISTYGIPELSNLLRRVGFKNFEVITLSYKENRERKAAGLLMRSILKVVPMWLRGRQLLATVNN